MPTEQGTHNTEISDSAKLDAIGDILADAVRRFDSIEKRMDSQDRRFDSLEGKGAVKEPGEPSEPTADSRKDSKGEREEDCNVMDSARRDSEEEKERERADAARRDSEEKERAREDSRRRDSAEEKERADAARRDSESRAEMDSMATELADLKAKLASLTPRSRSDSDAHRFATIQEQAEPAFQAFSDRAPAPMEGETPLDYKRRLAGRMQKHSPKWDGQPLNSISDEGVLDRIAGEIYADSISAARTGGEVMPGELREHSMRSAAGHTITTFEGGADSWMNGFAGHSQRATGRFLTPN